MLLRTMVQQKLLKNDKLRKIMEDTKVDYMDIGEEKDIRMEQLKAL